VNDTLEIIRRGLRRIFKSAKRHQEFPPRAAARAVAEYLSGGIEGASLVWCGCGELLAPIVVCSEGEQAEVVALGCVHNGCGAVPVNLGILIDAEHAKRQSLH
jgi:hypothetical protein